MKSFRNWMIAAAAMAAAAGSASAQTTMMKAEVPFAFRTATGKLQPGPYEVRVGHDGIVYLLNAETHRTTLANPAGPEDVKKEWKEAGSPVIVFECAAGDCGLRAIYRADGNPALRFPGLKAKHGETHMAMLPLVLVKK